MTMHDKVSRPLASTSELSAEERQAVRASLAVVGVVFAGMVGGAMAIGHFGQKTVEATLDEPTRVMALAVTPGHPSVTSPVAHR